MLFIIDIIIYLFIYYYYYLYYLGERPETRDEREKRRETKKTKTSEHDGYKRKSDEKQVIRRNQERPEDRMYVWGIAKSSHNETYKKKPPK